MRLSILLLGSFSIAHSLVLLPRGPTCSEITVPVSVRSTNALLDSGINSQDGLRGAMQNILSGVLGLILNVNINGNYNIRARYCEPEVQNSERADTIQLLVHGITYTRDYWSGLGAPGSNFGGDDYSWIAYASKQGYPTLSIDRLGNGESDRPNGLAEVQMNTHIEVTESLIKSLKKGSIGGRSFSKIIYVGHWYGSLIGNLHAVKYPTSVDSYVLTGFSKKIRPSLLPTVIAGAFLPATIAYPERWAGQALTYFAASNEDGANGLFFVNDTVDPELRELNYRLRGTVTAGEFLTGYESTQVASNYRGRVFVLTGQNDAIFCSPDSFGQGTLNGQGDCGTGEDSIIAQTQDLYPAVANYDYDTPENIGHCNILHIGAVDQFATVHDWLDQFY
ncbi:Bgt-51650 [Blumeria graminis f. sp. tritici]|uniref:Bgt-51650 n=1 Tax=Blumeria graminis f. sp. tritici TaxID=62690 RepID=A0A9X9MKA4_BLUGR|nr:Bgt-51650 [Blumeria graminis f. sp. tritici]